MFDYKTTEWLALGVGVNYFNLQVNAESSNIEAVVDYTFAGPQVFAQFTF